MCICMCIYIYIYIYAHVCVYTYIYIYICAVHRASADLSNGSPTLFSYLFIIFSFHYLAAIMPLVIRLATESRKCFSDL